MRVLYLARHGQRVSNDDEGGVAHALTSLGHEVIRVAEPTPRRKFGRLIPPRPVPDSAVAKPADVLLFHHYGDWEQLRRFPHPKAFWYFDLVDWPADPTLAARSAARRAWMESALSLAGVGFCTDGDFAARHPDELVWLPQGADERAAGAGPGRNAGRDVLFTGIGRGGGRGRESFVEEMYRVYGGRFLHVERGVHGRDLANLIAAHPITVAPDSPVTDRYCSNRVWNACGFGAFLLHPKCEFLADCYEDRKEIVYYRNRAELHELIAWYLPRESERRRIAGAALQRTLKQHLYRHRCEKLIQTIRERLL